MLAVITKRLPFLLVQFHMAYKPSERNHFNLLLYQVQERSFNSPPMFDLIDLIATKAKP
ncbi:hypothetical protein Clo1100_1318 [Clostridium sp. BNL1100]|nr:hypothetical protein Clo1100_1318 [Clostridium sp. BNL1100]